ncbi:hypothetical protein ACFQ3P_34720 [Paraburkholderia sabiae]|uniref:Lipoyl-binding domain-containing protein n=1 Tax=Paraburkholderia sabiae TaxID=273251 RepID=A0ABU9QLI1_9BURK|nr:hypothetical protein [Paraburkholderia sabiae]WJZ79259.1 hypothetical protein QEN71_41210 [Paraburkholderia sabiae]CAD6560755.1 hypothetical protein LMG24235_07062 [Paraburkholderia sabiae]
MMDVLEKLSGAFKDSDCSELDYCDDKIRFILRRLPTQFPHALVAEEVVASANRREVEKPETKIIRAKASGCFSSAHPLTGAPATAPGEEVKAGDTVGYLVVGEALSRVASPAAGVVVSFDVQHGQLVGFGEAVARVAPCPT